MKRRTLAMLLALCLLSSGVPVWATGESGKETVVLSDEFPRSGAGSIQQGTNGVIPPTDISDPNEFDGLISAEMVTVYPHAIEVQYTEGIEYLLLEAGDETDPNAEGVEWVGPSPDVSATIVFSDLTEGTTYLLYCRAADPELDPGAIGPVAYTTYGENYFLVTWWNEDALLYSTVVEAGAIAAYPAEAPVPTASHTSEVVFEFIGWEPQTESGTFYEDGAIHENTGYYAQFRPKPGIDELIGPYKVIVHPHAIEVPYVEDYAYLLLEEGDETDPNSELADWQGAPSVFGTDESDNPYVLFSDLVEGQTYLLYCREVRNGDGETLGPVAYTTYGENFFLVEWWNEDILLASAVVEAGTIAEYPGEEPTYLGSEELTYMSCSFDCWEAQTESGAVYEDDAIHENTKYYARFSFTPFFNIDMVLGIDMVTVYPHEIDIVYTRGYEYLMLEEGDESDPNSAAAPWRGAVDDGSSSSVVFSDLTEGATYVFYCRSTEVEEDDPTSRAMGPVAYTTYGENYFLVTWEDHWEYPSNTWTEYARTVVEAGAMAEYPNEEPQRETEAATYTFIGWEPHTESGTSYEDGAIHENTAYYAQYEVTPKRYTITWLNYDGSELGSWETPYGEWPDYLIYAEDDRMPFRLATAEATYTFVGWEPELTAVTEDATYTAVYEATPQVYTVTWLDYDGSELAVQELAYGEVPAYPNEATPSRADTAEATYTFTGWNPELTSVTQNASYTAVYEATPKVYTVTWLNYDGSELARTELPWGEIPVYPGAEDPVRPAEGEVLFRFSGWSPEPQPVRGNVSYTATYESWQEEPDPDEESEPIGTGWTDEVLHAAMDGELPGENWYQRSKLPSYAINLYQALVLGSDLSGSNELLANDVYFDLPDTVPPPVLDQTPIRVEEYVYADPFFLSGQAPTFPLTETTLLEESYSQIDPGISDQAIHFAQLLEGDIVRTATFNGILVKKIQKTDNADFDVELQTARERIVEAYHAFDRDHPEVFWLNGQAKVRITTVSQNKNDRQMQTAYLFFVLADNSGFTLRAPDYSSTAQITADANERDRLVAEILATIPETDVYAQIRALNAWLTQHNEYNTTPDLSTIGDVPHRCLTALRGSVGNDGPVCDGYSRAFKLLCDRLGIPCLLENGFARSSATHAGEYHMWNTVQMPGEKWYGMDVTWNDPRVAGISGAHSGYENENFLLVGSNTEILGLRFADSHIPTSQLTAATAIAGTVLNPTAYSIAAAVAHPVYVRPVELPIAIPDEDLPLAALPVEFPFTDVQSSDWFYDPVRYVFNAGIMQGVGGGRFDPGKIVTRAELVTILYRLEDAPTVEEAASFSDLPPDTWYTAPVSWAAANGVVLGFGDGSFGPEKGLTREQLALMLWRYAEKPEGEGELSQFSDADQVDDWAADALRWCVGKGIITGKGGGILDPLGVASRAEIATMLMRFMQLEDCKRSITVSAQ